MSVSKEVFITCAVTGAGENVRKSDKVPITPQQIARDVLEAAKAGAAICHIHVRDPKTGVGSREVSLYREVVDRIRSSGVDVIINLTAGMGGDLVIGSDDPHRFGPDTDLIGQLERLAHVEALLPEICTLDCGSYNVGRGHRVYISTSEMIRSGAERIRQLGVKPELELFEMGQIWFAKELMEAQQFAPPTMVQLCLGVPYSAPATPEAFIAMKSMLPQNNVVWSAFGVGQMQLPMIGLAVTHGGNVRVGLEDNLYLSKGMLATNAQLVDRARTIIESLNVGVLTPAQTRIKLGLKPAQV